MTWTVTRTDTVWRLAAPSRRGMLCMVCATAAAAVMTAPVDADEATAPARDMRAQVGDQFVPFDGDEGDDVLKAVDIKSSDGLVLAWPRDPTTKLVRNGSRLNAVLLMRCDMSKLSLTEKSRAADGIFAFTAVCTHQACWATDWLTTRQLLQCPCHQSEYRPAAGRQGGFRPSAATAAGTAAENGRRSTGRRCTFHRLGRRTEAVKSQRLAEPMIETILPRTGTRQPTELYRGTV